MNDIWKERWNERYREEQYAYGKLPNHFLKEQVEKLPIGKILFPAEGEGRNAVFAAKLGWQVSAFDISVEGQKKAIQLAEFNQVQLDYHVGDIIQMEFKPSQFDAIALIYAHFPAEIKSHYHKTLSTYLRTGGIIILEAFSKNNLKYVALNPNIGGPKDIDTLCSIEEIKHDFPNYEIIQLEEKEIELQEGVYHNGVGSAIRFVGRKK